VLLSSKRAIKISFRCVRILVHRIAKSSSWGEMKLITTAISQLYFTMAISVRSGRQSRVSFCMVKQLLTYTRMIADLIGML
jgi:hypothetical protein